MPPTIAERVELPDPGRLGLAAAPPLLGGLLGTEELLREAAAGPAGLGLKRPMLAPDPGSEGTPVRPARAAAAEPAAHGLLLLLCRGCCCLVRTASMRTAPPPSARARVHARLALRCAR